MQGNHDEAGNDNDGTLIIDASCAPQNIAFPQDVNLLNEFGTKLDLSVENGLGRIEKISFEAYNESEVLIPAIENYYKRNGHYPERVLADKIYRN